MKKIPVSLIISIEPTIVRLSLLVFRLMDERGLRNLLAITAQLPPPLRLGAGTNASWKSWVNLRLLSREYVCSVILQYSGYHEKGVQIPVSRFFSHLGPSPNLGVAVTSEIRLKISDKRVRNLGVSYNPSNSTL